MRTVFTLMLFLLGSIPTIGFAQTKEAKKGNFTVDFFYGAWVDRFTKPYSGICLGPKNMFYIIYNEDVEGGYHKETNLELTYELNLNKYPVELILTSRYIDSGKIKKRGITIIEVIDTQHIIWSDIDENGKAINPAKYIRVPKF